MMFAVVKQEAKKHNLFKHDIQCWFIDFMWQTKWPPLGFYFPLTAHVCVLRDRKQTNKTSWEAKTTSGKTSPPLNLDCRHINVHSQLHPTHARINTNTHTQAPSLFFGICDVHFRPFCFMLLGSHRVHRPLYSDLLTGKLWLNFTWHLSISAYMPEGNYRCAVTPVNKNVPVPVRAFILNLMPFQCHTKDFNYKSTETIKDMIDLNTRINLIWLFFLCIFHLNYMYVWMLYQY